MKHFSSCLYKHMVKALGKALYRKDMPQYQPGAPLQPDESADLNMVVWADPQISVLSPLRAARVACACKDIRRAKGRYDALILAGDLTEYGALCEYKMLSDLLKTIAHQFDKVLAVPGNHDIRLRRYDRQRTVFDRFLGSVKGAVRLSGNSYFRSFEINGYPFLLLGADKTCFEGSYISDDRLQQIDRILAASDKTKPVFVVNHQPIKLTNGLPMTFLGKGKWRGSVGNESDKLRAVFEKYTNVVFITGHLHYCTSRYTYEDCGRFHAISAPTVGVINHGEFTPFSQGLVLSVTDNEVKARARVFGEGRDVRTEYAGAEFSFAV